MCPMLKGSGGNSKFNTQGQRIYNVSSIGEIESIALIGGVGIHNKFYWKLSKFVESI